MCQTRSFGVGLGVKKFGFLLSLLALSCNSTAATVKQSAKADQQAVVTQQAAFIKTARNAIAACNAEFENYKVMDHMADVVWRSAYDANVAMARLTHEVAKKPDREAPPLYHVECVSKQKGDVIPQLKPFVDSFKASDSRVRAREMAAQWITAMDGIGKQGSQTEAAKFETLANGLLIDMQ
jgi:hypothetical protein